MATSTRRRVLYNLVQDVIRKNPDLFGDNRHKVLGDADRRFQFAYDCGHIIYAAVRMGDVLRGAHEFSVPREVWRPDAVAFFPMKATAVVVSMKHTETIETRLFADNKMSYSGFDNMRPIQQLLEILTSQAIID